MACTSPLFIEFTSETTTSTEFGDGCTASACTSSFWGGYDVTTCPGNLTATQLTATVNTFFGATVYIWNVIYPTLTCYETPVSVTAYGENLCIKDFTSYMYTATQYETWTFDTTCASSPDTTTALSFSCATGDSTSSIAMNTLSISLPGSTATVISAATIKTSTAAITTTTTTTTVAVFNPFSSSSTVSPTTYSSSSSNSSSSDSSSSSVSPGAIVGILIAIIFVVAVGIFCYRRKLQFTGLPPSLQQVPPPVPKDNYFVAPIVQQTAPISILDFGGPAETWSVDQVEKWLSVYVNVAVASKAKELEVNGNALMYTNIAELASKFRFQRIDDTRKFIEVVGALRKNV
ncbi:hypothetical protein HK100_000830 [Physocladia obscura]|uniref:Transmembrane protein n=1 Tax=Physocladia obscura TaxID=109957 RepID=A0AAD5TDP8_9FUNG|nr:hypothetical protein HK100_000830 [Physocladia obscura]